MRVVCNRLPFQGSDSSQLFINVFNRRSKGIGYLNHRACTYECIVPSTAVAPVANSSRMANGSFFQCEQFFSGLVNCMHLVLSVWVLAPVGVYWGLLLRITWS